jgi:two-component system sensor histidine kinase DesK
MDLVTRAELPDSDDGGGGAAAPEQFHETTGPAAATTDETGPGPGPGRDPAGATDDNRSTRSDAWRMWWRRGIRSARHRNTRGWYIGAAFGLAYQVLSVYSIWSDSSSLLNHVVTTVLLIPLFAGFAFIPPLVWQTRMRDRVVAFSAYLLYSLAFFPLIGASTFWLWVLVAVVGVVIFEEFWVVAPIVFVLSAIPLVYGFATGFSDPAVYSSILTFSVSSMMFAMNQQIRAVRELREAQSEIARLAVVEERSRFSRDLHDVLGHSLTVVTVKSELARRLVRLDPAAAETEIADIERLSRSALADLRSAVAGYREMNLSTELAVAQSSLAAANIAAHLPSDGDAVDPRLRELFGWVLREAVTNVIRHSGAANCWVEISGSALRVEDDGNVCNEVPAEAGTGGGVRALANGVRGPVAGNGLTGLAERALAAGATLTFGPRAGGGFVLEIRGAVA